MSFAMKTFMLFCYENSYAMSFAMKTFMLCLLGKDFLEIFAMKFYIFYDFLSLGPMFPMIYFIKVVWRAQSIFISNFVLTGRGNKIKFGDICIFCDKNVIFEKGYILVLVLFLTIS